MSGGSHNYICYQIEEYLCGQMKDPELDDLINDIAELAHDLEWADSGDISIKKYHDTVQNFKHKWFESDRTERLKGYVDENIEKLKKDMYEMLGVYEDEKNK